MKKAKIWIRACVCILLYATFAACSRGTGKARTDDDDRISLLKQNIPKDYKIPVRFIPQNMSGSCWVALNAFPLEESLKDLERMFGSVSTNRKNISALVLKLQDIRYHIQAKMETMMQDFNCHYKTEEWPTERFFDYVGELLDAAGSRTGSAECDSPPCETTAPPRLPTEGPLTTSPAKAADCVPAADCQTRVERQYLPEEAQKGLLTMFLVSVLANICLLTVMVRGRRRRAPDRNAESGDVFITEEEHRAPSDHGPSEKNRLNSVRAI